MMLNPQGLGTLKLGASGPQIYNNIEKKIVKKFYAPNSAFKDITITTTTIESASSVRRSSFQQKVARFREVFTKYE